MRSALCLALLVACGEPAVESAEPSVRGDLGPLDALARRFGRVRRRMTERGYGVAVALERTFALEGEGVAFPLDLPVSQCTTFVALAGGGVRDLRLTLYDGNGAELAIDSVPGEAGLVHVCPERTEGAAGIAEAAPYHLTMQAIQGSGGIVAAAFESDSAGGEGFEGLFDGVLAPPAPFQPVEEALASARAALRDRGLVAEGEASFARLAEGQVVRTPIALESGRCVAVVARSTDSLRDVDLYLYGPSGAEVARDLGVDSEPQLEHCPTQSGTATVELRAFEGSGALGWMVWSSAAPEPDETEPPAAERTTDPLEQVARSARALAARGYGAPLVVVRDGAVAPGEGRSHEIAIGPGCGLVIGAAGPGDLDLDLYLQAPDGSVVDRDTRVRPTARVGACPDERVVYRLAVKGYGRGSYSIAQLAAPPEIRDVASLRAEEPIASLIARGYHPVARERIRAERTIRRLPSFRGCVALVVAGDAGVEDIDLVVLDAESQRVASDTGPAPWARVAVCDEEHPTASQFAIVPYRGEGEVVVQWLERR